MLFEGLPLLTTAVLKDRDGTLNHNGQDGNRIERQPPRLVHCPESQFEPGPIRSINAVQELQIRILNLLSS